MIPQQKCNNDVHLFILFQRERFALYALYSKNKPQSDRLLISHGQTFFKVNTTACLCCLSLYLWATDPATISVRTWIRNCYFQPCGIVLEKAPEEQNNITIIFKAGFRHIRLADVSYHVPNGIIARLQAFLPGNFLSGFCCSLRSILALSLANVAF